MLKEKNLISFSLTICAVRKILIVTIFIAVQLMFTNVHLLATSIKMTVYTNSVNHYIF